jgi:hypothetical protein
LKSNPAMDFPPILHILENVNLKMKGSCKLIPGILISDGKVAFSAQVMRCNPWESEVEYILHIQLHVERGDSKGSSLDETGKMEAPCRSSCGMIKISPCSKTLSAEQRPNFATFTDNGDIWVKDCYERHRTINNQATKWRGGDPLNETFKQLCHNRWKKILSCSSADIIIKM